MFPKHTFPQARWTMRECRMAYLNSKDRKDAFEASENPKKSSVSPEKSLDQWNEHFIKRVNAASHSWFGKERKVKTEITDHAKIRLLVDYPELAKRWTDIFNGEKRKMRHLTEKRIQSELRQQLLDLEQQKNKKAVEMQAAFSRLAKGFSGPAVRIRRKNPAKPSALTQILQRHQSKAAPVMVPAEAKRAWDAEVMLRKELLRLKIVPASELHAMFDENANGSSRRLADIIQASPAIDAATKKMFMDNCAMLRRNSAYRAFYAGSSAVGFTLESRWTFLKMYPFIEGAQIVVNIPDQAQVNLYVSVRTSDGRMELTDKEGKRRFSLFLPDGTDPDGYLVYRDEQGKIREMKLTLNNFVINPKEI